MEFVSAVCESNQEILGIAQRDPASLVENEFEISLKCLQEELDEFIDAVDAQDYVGQIDALVDLLYFGIGVLYKLGLTPEQIHECCMAVHHANMSKKRGTNAKRDTGAADAVKPEGWVPPEQLIQRIIMQRTTK